MKLSTRIKISYVLLCLVTIALIGVMTFAITRMNMDTLEKKYDVSGSGISMITSPAQMFGNMTSSAKEELSEVMEESPDQLGDVEYLEELNGELSQYSSYLIACKGEDIIYQGVSVNEEIVFDENYLLLDVESGNIYVDEPVPYYLAQMGFSFSDGTNGRVCIVTDLTDMMPQAQKAVFWWIVIAIVILLLTGMVLMMWLYKSIVKPLGVLKAAVENIKEGNLNFTVKAESNDEIGELCVAFEEMRKKLKEQIDVSMQYEKENKELISNISHDLKTPITAIVGYVEGIMDGVADTPEKQERYLKTIYTKATDMEKMIEELFLYSKLDSNSMTYSFTKVNVNDYFEDCVEEISLDLEQKGIEVNFFNYADKDVVIIADPEQLKRVIMNIVGNSAKYIGKKRGIINIRIREEAEFVQVEIEDNGKGIAKDEIGRIFDRCYRTDASRNSAQGGSGLGLAIAKKIVEEHGGHIWATSRENIGTSICFVIRKYEENRVYE